MECVIGLVVKQIAGKWMKGARLRGSGGSLTQKLVGLGYQQVCGNPEVWGDGITPVPAAHLEGKLPAYYLMLLRNPASHTGVGRTLKLYPQTVVCVPHSMPCWPGKPKFRQCSALEGVWGVGIWRCCYIRPGTDMYTHSKICSAVTWVLCAAGAEQITLDGVYHSPLGGGVSRPWYGSPEVLERWIRVVYDGKELDTDFQVELGDMVAPKK